MSDSDGQRQLHRARPGRRVTWRFLLDQEAREFVDEGNVRSWEPRGTDLDAEFDDDYTQPVFRAWSEDRVYFSDEDALGYVVVRSVPRHPNP